MGTVRDYSSHWTRTRSPAHMQPSRLVSPLTRLRHTPSRLRDHQSLPWHTDATPSSGMIIPISAFGHNYVHSFFEVAQWESRNKAILI